MKADLSRDTFDRAQHYSAVRLQQGRVVTDADWNEQADITRYRAEREARDTIGPCGAPLDAAGYRLVAATYAFAVHALNANVVWIAAEDGALLATTNGGADWALADVQTASHLRAIASAGSTAWVVGDVGTVRKTSDAGANWSARDADTLATLRGVAAVDADHLWAVGDGGIVVATSDGGATWRLAQTSATRLYAVDFVDALNGLAVGRSGVIVSTSDGGQTWNAVTSDTAAHLRAITRADATRVWVAGNNGTILRSTDGGASWLPCATPSTATLHAISFLDLFEGWAVGENGTVLHSTDGGASWQLEDTGIGNATLRALSVFGAEAWAVGDTGAALRLGAGSPGAIEVALPAVNLSIEPGRTYVDGTLCELEARCSYANQPDGGAAERLAPGAHLLYLHAWQRHASALEAPAIRELALGGPDTATRARTIAQVRALSLPAASPFDYNCASSIAAWDELTSLQRPRLAARAEPQLAATNLCEIAATAGYRRLENQLYRVEVHEGGANPTFKWSRENGSVAYAVLSVTIDPVAQRTTVRVAARGRDANLDLAAHDRVELIDDEAELTQRRGTMLEYLADGDDALELVLAGVPEGTIGQIPSRHPLLRRWDQKPTAANTHLLPIVADTWIELEDGVQIRFESGGVYRPGDYWQIPARTITGDVEWPRDDDGDPIARDPAGIADAYCRLGIVEVDGDGVVQVLSDCRELFPPLTALEQLLYVSGDGQDAPPNALLAQPLKVRVARGSVPAGGRGVRFAVVTGSGKVGATAFPSATVFETVTDAYGHASCRWQLGPGFTSPARDQTMRATLLDDDGQPLPGQQLEFAARSRLALHAVGGQGQQAAPNTALAQLLEVRVSDGVDGIASVALVARVDAGGGALTTPSPAVTDAQGRASFGWQLGGAGPQRLVVELRDAANAIVQEVAFSATAVVPVTTARRGCTLSVGPGGDIDDEKLTPEQLAKELDRAAKLGEGHVCLCLLPGRHGKGFPDVDGQKVRRLTVHGCGRASVVVQRKPWNFVGLEALTLHDLDLLLDGGGRVVVEKCDDVRCADLHASRKEGLRDPMLSFRGVGALQFAACEVSNPLPGIAVAFVDIERECRVVRCRFDGIAAFYGDSVKVPAPGALDQLIERVANGPRLLPTLAQLTFADNRADLLACDDGLLEKAATSEELSGVFASAFVRGNSLGTVGCTIAAGLVAWADNVFAGKVVDKVPYGVVVANRATATGNLAADFNRALALHIVTPDKTMVAHAANQVPVLP